MPNLSQQVVARSLAGTLPRREVMRAAFAVQASDNTERTFTGMASVFNTLIDAWIPTRILPGAFSRTLGDKLQSGRVKILWQHDDREPIGRPLSMVENSDGLLVNGKLSNIQRGNEAITLMQDEVITEMSIGFDPATWEITKEGVRDIRLIRDLTLWEFSLVTFAANPDAKVFSVHSLARQVRSRIQHAWNGTLTPEAGVVDSLIDALDSSYDVLLGSMQMGGDQDDADTQAATILREGLASAILPVLIKFAALYPKPGEAHEGKVLSAKNKQLVGDALAALQALINAATSADDEGNARAASDVAARLRTVDLMALEMSLTSGAIAHA